MYHVRIVIDLVAEISGDTLIETEEEEEQDGRIVKMTVYTFNNFPVIRYWSFFEDPHIFTLGTLS